MTPIETSRYAIDRHKLPTTIETEGFQLISIKIDDQGITKIRYANGIKESESHFSFANIHKITCTPEYYAIVTRLKHTEVTIPYRAFRSKKDRARFEKLLIDKQVHT